MYKKITKNGAAFNLSHGAVKSIYNMVVSNNNVPFNDFVLFAIYFLEGIFLP